MLRFRGGDVNSCGIRAAGLLALGFFIPACGIGGSGTLTPTVAPGIPADVAVRPGNRSATISWSPSAPGSSYTVLRSLTGSGPFFPVSVPANFRNPTTYVDSGLANGTTYYYAVQAGNTFGVSSPSPPVAATPDFKPASICASSGSWHHAVVLPDGSVWEWGVLGAYTSNAESDVPVPVPGLTDATSISVGDAHGLALTSDGHVWAWGDNAYGQLGIGTLGGLPVIHAPVQVPGLDGMIAVAAGGLHSLALSHDGTVWSWGYNNSGQLGTIPVGVTTTVPKQIPGMSGIVAIAAERDHCLALRPDGLVYAWGLNDFGQLGNGTTSTVAQTTPTLVDSLNGVTAIAVAFGFSIALRTDGTVWCWGNNTYGSLGTGTTSATPVTKPVPALGVTGATAIACAEHDCLVVMNRGAVWSWGTNTQDKLGYATTGFNPSPTPTPIPGLSDIRSVAGTMSSSMALGMDGTVWCWGDNNYGELGTGTGPEQAVARLIPNLTGVKAIAAGSGASQTIRTDGTVWEWGNGTSGQMANGGATSITPVQTIGLTNTIAAKAGQYFFLALIGDGTVRGWGYNVSGQVGIGTTSSSVNNVTPVLNLSGISSISAGTNHGLAVKNDGTVWTWGYNGQSQLGYTTPGTTSPTPASIPGFSGVSSAAGGDSVSLALKSDGTVWSWGTGNFGELGLGSSTTLAAAPTAIPSLSGVVAISAASSRALAVRNDGTVWTWGGNTFPLGSGGPQNAFDPFPVPNLSGIVAVSSGMSHDLALRGDGTVWAWGYNTEGELGAPVAIFSYTPVQVLGLPPVVAISGGRQHSLALESNGTVWGWGTNISGELGTVRVTMSVTPVPVHP
jgi:alpha-tubulin suppressor-like RCC1 family protein